MAVMDEDLVITSRVGRIGVALAVVEELLRQNPCNGSGTESADPVEDEE